MKKQLVIALAAAGLTAASALTQAYEQGDVILRAGVATVVPNDDSEAIILPGLPEDLLANGVGVDNGTAISLIGAWMINDNWALELLAATPFEHDIDVRDLGIAAGSVKHLPPTLSLQWYPRGGMPGWQPYLGLGLNYTTFFDEEVDPALGGVLGEVLGASTAKLSLDDSFGWAAQAGVDIPINEDWAFNLGVWYIDIGTTASINAGFDDGSSATVRFDVDIDPVVWNVGVSYKF
jgi:outer membrane protein